MPVAIKKAISAPAPTKASVFRRLGDTLANVFSGMGSEKDKLAGTYHQLALISQAECDAAYRTDWMARKLVDIPAYDATREWRAWQGTPEQITALEDTEKNLGILWKVMSAMQKARLYGGGALILGVNQGNNEDELVYENIKKGDLQFVHAVSRWDVSASTLIRDIASPYFGEPEYYERTSHDSTGQMLKGTRFHPSRVIRFIGSERQDALQAGEAWGDPVLQVVGDAIRAGGMVVGSTAQLVAEAKIDIIGIPGLSEHIMNKEYEQGLTQRFAVANMIKSVYSMLLLDKEEEWNRQTVTFTGLPDLLQMFLLITSGAADIPATRFLGQSPAGLSSTGESDLRNYYDNVGTQQKVIVSPKLTRLDNVLIPSALGNHPPELFYMWNPLWQMTAKEKAEVDKAQADIFNIDVNAGVIDSNVLKAARENQIIESGVYPGFEQALEEFDGTGEENVDPNQNAANENDPNNFTERSPDDPNANPDKMAGEGEGNDPASKPKPKKTATRDSRILIMRDGEAGATLKQPTFAMLQRFNDATPRTAYVRRDLLNIEDIRTWAKAQGFGSILNDLHVTLCYSKDRFDWIKVGPEHWNEDENGNLKVRAGGPRVMEQFGTAQVLVFGSDVLTWRHMRLRDFGASFDFDDYNPHVTITYKGDPARLHMVEPYKGELLFGPEIWQEIDMGFNNETDVKEESL